MAEKLTKMSRMIQNGLKEYGGAVHGPTVIPG
jgi:hypothetical protein